MNKQELLEQVTSISKRYEANAKSTGERFNIFRILGVESREVKTHSAFIAELLNPKGSHEQGDYFLNMFCELFKIEDFDHNSANAQIEKHLGTIDSQYDEGGFVDILVTDGKKNAIVIENKIYAGDQPNQLWRYKKSFPNSHLLYLTLDGKDPSEGSANGLQKEKDYRVISYQNDIKVWLEKSVEGVKAHGLLYQTLVQYINLIKHLTNQTTNDKMKEEIVKAVFNDQESLRSFLTLTSQDIISSVKRQLLDKFQKQMKELADDFLLVFHKPDSWGNSNDELEFRFPDKDFCYAFGFCGNNQERFVYGVYTKDEQKKNELTSKYRNVLGKGIGWGNWIWIEDFEAPFSSWNRNNEAWLSIENGTLKENIRQKIQKLNQVKEEEKIEI